MTLAEIAKLANVSVSTVSRVINGKVSKKTKNPTYDLIWEIVQRENYTPNISARNLRNPDTMQDNQMKTFACLLARKATQTDDPFFSNLSRSIDTQAFKQNYIVKHLFSMQDLLTPQGLKSFSDDKVDGLILMGRCEPELLKAAKRYFKYVAYVGLIPLNAKYDQVICSGLHAGIEATNYLLNAGDRSIAYIGETKNEPRYDGYCQALKAAGIEPDLKYVSDITLSLDGGFTGALDLIRRGIDISAVFCANDTTAIGAIKAFQREKIRIPKDISIIGIDDIEMSNYSTPPLTTVHIPIQEMGQTVTRVLIDRIEQKHFLQMEIRLPYYVIERNSVLKIK